MLRGVIQDHLMCGIMQKRRTAFHRLKNPAFAFDAQGLRRDALALGHPEDQRFRLMDIPRVAQRDAYLTEAALQTRPVLSLSFLMRSEIPLEDCYLFDEAGSWSGKPKKATSDGP